MAADFIEGKVKRAKGKARAPERPGREAGAASHARSRARAPKVGQGEANGRGGKGGCDLGMSKTAVQNSLLGMRTNAEPRDRMEAIVEIYLPRPRMPNGTPTMSVAEYISRKVLT